MLGLAVAGRIATFLLVFVTCSAGALSKSDRSDQGGLVSQLGASVAGGLIVMIYTVGRISGAHMNPASRCRSPSPGTSLGFRCPSTCQLRYLELLLASFILQALLHPIDGSLVPSGTADKALVAEMVVTFNMVFVTCAVATDTKAVLELASLAVGSAACISCIRCKSF